MIKPELSKPKPQSLGGIRRKAIDVSSQALVRVSELQAGKGLPLRVQPALEGVHLIEWVEAHRAWIDHHLLTRGALLFRNFSVNAVSEFEQLIQTACGDLLPYTHRSSPRSPVSGNIYTSTDYPPDLTIPLHNEMSYNANWPMRICFYCVKAAEAQGETPIADSRRVFNQINPQVRDRFMEKKVMYVRNFGDGLDLHWQDVFQTKNPEVVEVFCRQNGISFEWKEGGRLRTRQVCQSVARHPKTHERVWFNQAHLFHVSSLPPTLREMLLSTYKEEDLPRHAFYGDGSPIEPSALEEIRRVYDNEAVLFPWQKGDVLMMDNMLAAHGRQPFIGTRQIVVGMAEPYEVKTEP